MSGANEIAEIYREVTEDGDIRRLREINNVDESVSGDIILASFSFNAGSRLYQLTIEDTTPDV